MRNVAGLLLFIAAALIGWQLWRCSPDRPATYSSPPGAESPTEAPPPETPTPEEMAVRRARIEEVLRRRAGRF